MRATPADIGRHRADPPQPMSLVEEARKTLLNRPGLRFRTIAEIEAEGIPEIDWTVDGLLPEGTLSIFSGPPKGGKSTTVACLGAAIATKGRNWLNCETQKGPVLHLALEEHPALVIERYKNLSVNPNRIAILSELEHAYPLKQLEESLLEWCPVLVIFDPIMRFLKLDNAYDYATVSNALDPLIHLVRKYNTHGIMVTHSPHASPTRSLGSQAFDGSCAAQLTMKRDGKTRLLSVTGRGGVEEIEDAVLRMDDSGWISTPGTKAEVRTREEQSEIMSLIVDHLDEHGSSNVSDIQRGIKKQRKRVKSALDRLVTLRNIKATGTGMKGDPIMYAIDSVPGTANAVPERH